MQSQSRTCVKRQEWKWKEAPSSLQGGVAMAMWQGQVPPDYHLYNHSYPDNSGG